MKEFDRRRFLKIVTSVVSSRIEIDPIPPLLCQSYYFHEITSEDYFARFVLSKLGDGGEPISGAKLLHYFETGQKLWRGKPFILTLDDALLSQLQYAFPFLVQYKIPAIFAVMPGWRGDRVHKYMIQDNFKELVQAGMELASHTINHADLPSLRKINQGGWEAEIVQSKTALENIIGKKVIMFCYPYGAYDTETLALVAQNYQMAFSTRSGNLQKADEILILPRKGMP